MPARTDNSGVRGPEDDWFAAAPQQPTDAEELPWEDEREFQIRESAPKDLIRCQTAIVLSVVAAGILVAGGVAIGRITANTTTQTVTVAATPSTQQPPVATIAPNTKSPGVGTTSPNPIAVPTNATLQRGNNGAAVLSLQKALAALGYSPGTADGAYGATTVQAVASFQTAKGLTADGVAGAKTLAALNAEQTSG